MNVLTKKCSSSEHELWKKRWRIERLTMVLLWEMGAGWKTIHHIDGCINVVFQGWAVRFKQTGAAYPKILQFWSVLTFAEGSSYYLEL